MDILFQVSGDVVEREELLNGTQTVAIEGSSEDGAWALTGTVAWNLGLRDFAGEGDLTLAREDGSEIFATLTNASVQESADDGAGGHMLRLVFEIDGGSGQYEGTHGGIDASGMLTDGSFRLNLAIRGVPPAPA